jgi:hypothetical protein
LRDRGVGRVARLIEKHGDARLTDLRAFLSANCPKQASVDYNDRGKALFEKLEYRQGPGYGGGIKMTEDGAAYGVAITMRALLRLLEKTKVISPNLIKGMIESIHEEIGSAQERGEISAETAAEASRTVGMIAAKEDEPDPGHTAAPAAKLLEHRRG